MPTTTDQAACDHQHPAVKSNLKAAHKLYEAFDVQDAQALRDAITPGFRGTVTEGRSRLPYAPA